MPRSKSDDSIRIGCEYVGWVHVVLDKGKLRGLGDICIEYLGHRQEFLD
jgi:hypothetical protein